MIVAQYPVKGVDLHDDEFEEIYEPIGGASDHDKDIRASSN